MNHSRIATTTGIPSDPTSRYHSLTHLKGLPIVLITDHHATEGVVTHIARPDRTSRHPAPVITLDTGSGTITCEVHSNDIIAPASEE